MKKKKKRYSPKYSHKKSHSCLKIIKQKLFTELKDKPEYDIARKLMEANDVENNIDKKIDIFIDMLNKQTKEIISGPEVLTRGFVYVKDSYDLIKEIKEISKNIILENTEGMKYIEYNKIKNSIRDELSKYLINQTGNKPMIITVMQEI